MWLTRAAINRPTLISMFFLAIVVLGWVSVSRMPVELRPNVDFPFVTIITTYQGAGPEEVETLITKPIEDAIGSIANIKNITSTSQDGISSVFLEFELGTDQNTAAADVREKVDSVRNTLPRDADAPTITKADVSAIPVLTLGIEGELSARELRRLADDVVKDRLGRVGGVASVSVSGGDLREIQVIVDKTRLDAYNLSILQVTDAIRNENLNVPAGNIKQGRQDFSVRVVGEFKTAEEVANMRLHIPDPQGLSPGWDIALGEIARVEDTVEDAKVISKLNGKPTVVLAVQKQSEANTVEVSKGVREELAQLEEDLPAGVKFTVATDEAVFVKEQQKVTTKELFLGIFFVILVVFLFIHSARATFIVAMAIPTSLVATFIPMTIFGFTLNFMTMLALSLAIGILVDDSIVVLENIDRHLHEGEPPREAALSGRTEIGLAAVTITLVDVVVFIPIAFMGGIVGMFFKSFGITVASATLFSLLVSFTLTPMLASKFYKRETKEAREERERKARTTFLGRLFHRFDVFYERLEVVYKRTLEWSLDNRWLTVVIGIVSLTSIMVMLAPPVTTQGGLVARGINLIVFVLLLGGSGFWFAKDKKVALGFLGVAGVLSVLIRIPIRGEFIPELDRGEIGITIEAPAGSSLKNTEEIATQVQNILDSLEETQFYVTTIGSSSAGGLFGGGDIGPQYSRISLSLVDIDDRDRSLDEVVAEIRQQVESKVSGAKITVFNTESQGIGGAPIAMEFTGSDQEELTRVADAAMVAMADIEGLRDITSSWKVGRPEVRVHVDRQRAMDLGMSTAQIAGALRTSIEGDTTSKFRLEGTEYNIRVQVDGQYRDTLDSVGNIIVGSHEGAPIYLEDVASVEIAAAPTKIDRKNRQRLVTVSAYLEAGAGLTQVQGRIDSALKDISMGNVRVSTGGAAQAQQESFGYIFGALALAIGLVYMLMAGLFESLFNPLVIMLSLPQALVGAILMLSVMDQSISIISMIGVIMLMGLVTKNAILLIDYTSTLRQRGKSRREAILEAGPTRLRPVLMTTFSLVAALLPVMFALSRGSEQRSPLAAAVIGGLLVSTLLTLLVIPATYALMEDFSEGLGRGFKRLYGRIRGVKA